MEKSCEAAAFQSCFGLLQKGLQHELGTIAPALYSESLISSEHRDQCLSRSEPSHERSAHLLAVLEGRVHVDPASLHVIIRELDSFPTLQVLATKLRSEFERIQGERSEMEAELQETTTDDVRDTSVSLTTSNQLACVSPTVLNVQQQIVSLESQFSNLVVQLICMLTILESESDRFVHRVRAALLAIPLSLKKQHRFFLECHRSTFTKASSVTEILDALCSYWDYLNVSLFEHMVMMFGGDEIKAEFKVYQEQLREFRRKTKLGDFIDALGEDRTALPPEFVEVQVKMGSSWDDRTLEDAEQLRLRLCRKAEIASYGVYFTGGRRKCIILTWGVAEMAVSVFLSVLDDTEQRECDILAIDYNTPVLDSLPTVKDSADTDAIEEEGPAAVTSVSSSPSLLEEATGGSDAQLSASGSDTVTLHETHQTRKIPKAHFEGSFKKNNSFARRKDMAASIRKEYPHKVPVIVERHLRDRSLPLLDKAKLLVPDNLTMREFIMMIRTRLGLSREKALYILVNGRMLPNLSITMDKVYEEKRDKDGFLYVVYDSAEFYGGDCIVL